jgi:hypothetical protein
MLKVTGMRKVNWMRKMNNGIEDLGDLYKWFEGVE